MDAVEQRADLVLDPPEVRVDAREVARDGAERDRALRRAADPVGAPRCRSR
jgi:hypothetical protein